MNLEEEILKNINDSWDTFTKARFIYIKLCELLVFNESFNFVDANEYNKIYNEKIDLKKLNKTEIVCSTWAYIYKELLKKIGVKATIFNMHHKWIEFKIDGYYIYADATIGIFNDLYKVKKGYKTINYGPIKIYMEDRTPIIATENEKDFADFYHKLVKADELINYKPKKIDYTNEIENIIKDELKNKDYNKFLEIKDKDEYIYKMFNFITSFANVSNLSYYDAKNHILQLENIFFSNIKFRDYISYKELCKKETQSKVDIILIIIIKQSNNQYKYFIYKKGHELVETNRNDILKLQDIGYGINYSSNCNRDYIEGIEEYTKKYCYSVQVKKQKLNKIKKLLLLINFKKEKNKSK